MTTTVLQNNLEKSVAGISRIITQKQQLPILSNILLSASKGELTLGATNLNESIRLSLPAKVEDVGDITIPGKLFAEFIHLLPAKPVSLSTTNQLLHVACENAQADFAGIAAAEFPKLPQVEGDPLVKIPLKMLEEMVSLVSFAASKDESRFHLTGILVKIGGNMLELVATDGFRLSLAQKPFKSSLTDQTFLLPAKTLEEIIRLAKDFVGQGEDTIALHTLADQNQVLFHFGAIDFASRLIEGNFPDYQRVIPKESTTTISIAKDSLLNAVRLASVFSRDSMAVIKMDVGVDSVTLRSDAKEIGNDVVKIDAEVEGEGEEIAFNPRYLLDILQTLQVETIKIELSGPLNPAVFRKEPEEEYLHVIMPVRT